MTPPVIEAENLQKSYGETRALRGVSFAVPAGTVLGVLGPNGAGKSTAVRILTTLALPDGGHGRVAGYDVVSEAAAVRRSIGVTAQDATLDAVLTGQEHVHGEEVRPQAIDELERSLARGGLAHYLETAFGEQPAQRQARARRIIDDEHTRHSRRLTASSSAFWSN